MLSKKWQRRLTPGTIESSQILSGMVFFMASHKSLPKQVLRTLSETNEPLTAKQIARRIGLRFGEQVTKSDVNKLLYGALAERVQSDTQYKWRLLHREDRTENVRPEDSSRSDSAKVVEQQDAADHAGDPAAKRERSPKPAGNRTLTCRRCKTQLTVSRSAAKKHFTCPGCGVEGRVAAKRQSQKKTQNTDQSWLPWVSGLLAKPHRKIDAQAKAFRDSLASASVQIANCRRAADTQL